MSVPAREAEKHLIKRVKPVLDEGVQHRKLSLKLTIVIDRDGSIAYIKQVLVLPERQLTEAETKAFLPFEISARRAVRQWKYKPFVRDDSPQVVSTEVVIRFKLNPDRPTS